MSSQSAYVPPPPSADAAGKGEDYFGRGKLDSKRLSWNAGVAPAATSAGRGEPNYGPRPPMPQAY